MWLLFEFYLSTDIDNITSCEWSGAACGCSGQTARAMLPVVWRCTAARKGKTRLSYKFKAVLTAAEDLMFLA